MKAIAAIVALLSWAVCAYAQTANDVAAYLREKQPLMDRGEISQLVFFRGLHAEIAATTPETYPAKLSSLRYVGKRIDVLEDMESGKISKERGERQLAEIDAEHETMAASQAADRQERENRARAAEAAQRANAEARRQQALAEEDERRRGIALQLLMQQQGRQSYQGTPYQMPIPRATNCTTVNMGGTLQTRCY